MASRKQSPASSPRMTEQKRRSEGDREKARAAGGGLRSAKVEAPAGRSASTGGRATPGSVRSSANSRSSNSGRSARSSKT